MKHFCLLLVFAFSALIMNAQPGDEATKDTTWKKKYRETYTRINDLVHTKLEVNFDYAKSFMYGKEWLTLKPHFYATDSLLLDAKGMDINELGIMKGSSKIPLKYTYDSMQLNIKLDKTYKGGENYTLYIDYTSKPNLLKVKGSAAINDAKGLYFINPKGENKDKPTQIWTQGETEANSVWMVTIDKPNQKSTEEIYMTVPSKYVTLSNGLLMNQKTNADGTRTDYWKMDLPHAPYLFFMGVGDFSITKDSYKGKEVSYYVEKKYTPYARGIFGNTPEMIKFYSEKLGVEYPWPKYSQIVGRDYVSGAMENTTATLHQESAYQNARQLVDGNAWEETIAHELFHQWFGDLVTAESWSNLTVNESFANYSEYLWDEYKYGKDLADEHNMEDMRGYLLSGGEKKDLVRFYYSDKEDMFDGVSYNKGGRILHMLRNYVGDDAFFKSLNNYLTTNKYKAGEAGQLRLAFEETTGKDMNWFWNQWYFGSGHPKVEINYDYDAANEKVMVFVKQTQKGDKVFKLPLAIDVYIGKDKKRYNVWTENREDTFVFIHGSKPALVNVDADKVMLWEKKDNKTADNFIEQWNRAPLYLDKKEALDYFSKNNMPELKQGLKDKFAGLRIFTISKLKTSKMSKDADVLAAIEKIAKTDTDKKTKAAAISYLAGSEDAAKYMDIYKLNVNDSSYSVSGASLEALAKNDATNAYALAKKFSTDAKGALGNSVSTILLESGTEADFDFIATSYDNSPPNQEKLDMSEKFGTYLLKINNVADLKKGIDYILRFRNLIPEQYRSFTDPSFKAALDKLGNEKGEEIKNYIKAEMK